MTHQLKHWQILTSGNRLIHDFAMFHVGSRRTPSGHADGPEGTSMKGWPPHRDRSTDSTASAFREDGSPLYSTIWVALTDATPYSSCLCVVPRRHDPGYTAGDGNKNPMDAIFQKGGGISALQYIRALPVSAGSLISFSHRLLHWGSAADETVRELKGHAPRIALSFASADPSMERPFLAEHTPPLPPITTRAGLVAGLALFYVANENPGMWRLNLYFDLFSASQAGGSFADTFAASVRRNYRACEAAWEVAKAAK